MLVVQVHTLFRSLSTNSLVMLLLLWVCVNTLLAFVPHERLAKLNRWCSACLCCTGSDSAAINKQHQANDVAMSNLSRTLQENLRQTRGAAAVRPAPLSSMPLQQSWDALSSRHGDQVPTPKHGAQSTQAGSTANGTSGEKQHSQLQHRHDDSEPARGGRRQASELRLCASALPLDSPELEALLRDQPVYLTQTGQQQEPIQKLYRSLSGAHVASFASSLLRLAGLFTFTTAALPLLLLAMCGWMKWDVRSDPVSAVLQVLARPAITRRPYRGGPHRRKVADWGREARLQGGDMEQGGTVEVEDFRLSAFWWVLGDLQQLAKAAEVVAGARYGSNSITCTSITPEPHNPIAS